MPRKPPPKVPHRHSIGSSVMDGNGQVTALNPRVFARLIEELEVGDYPAMAAIRAGCSPRSVERWVQWGCEGATAVEPYKSFAEAFVQVEARICGRLTKIIMDHALGRVRGKQKKPKGDPFWAERMLSSRFRFLYGVSKDGTTGGVTVTELVIQTIEAGDAQRATKARELLKLLPDAAKAQARQEGFQV
jgi:hypothetical protein